MRLMVAWCPDWPVIAAELVDGIPAHQPVVVLYANRVVACSEKARAEGIRRGLRRREAQSRCPQVTVVEYDADRDARAFEPVVAAVEELAPGVEILRPGACAFAARGPAGYYGSEEAAAERIVEHIAQSCAVEAQVGAAEGSFAASLAARRGVLVPPGQTPGFLADQDIALIERPALVDLLRRLGIATLGAFAALPAADVLARFGFAAALAHRLAAGVDEHPLAVREPPVDLTVEQRFDEPLERVDVAAFAARGLAERLHDRLTGHGLACTRLGITAVTEHGAELHRVWRHDGLLTAGGIADRLRWQLDGWLSGSNRGADRPTSGIIRLALSPEGVLAHAGLQLGLWGDAGVERDRAHRALHRVQGMLGPEAVLTAVSGGGRDPGDQVTLVPWGDERVPARPAGQPWPGRLPAPAPTVVLPEPAPALVLAADGTPVSVTARLVLSGDPATLVLHPAPAGSKEGSRKGRQQEQAIVSWAGPWPVDERWWAPDEASRRVRFQVCLADGRALLLTLRAGAWSVAASYD
jgi:protein ImuB